MMIKKKKKYNDQGSLKDCVNMNHIAFHLFKTHRTEQQSLN